MRPEIRDPLLALRDALPPDAASGLAFLCGPRDTSMDVVAWSTIGARVQRLIKRLLDPDLVLEDLDAEVELLGNLLALRVKAPTPWSWGLGPRRDGAEPMLVATALTDPPVFGMSLCLLMPLHSKEQVDRVRGPLYYLIGNLLGATHYTPPEQES